jgi:hypothetical protein
MRSFHTVLGTGLTVVLAGCASLPGPEEIGPGMDFNRARHVLFNADYSAYDVYMRGFIRQDPGFVGLPKQLRAAGLVEVEDCESDRPVCTFNYYRGSSCKRLTTQGDKFAEMRVTSVSNTCPPSR